MFSLRNRQNTFKCNLVLLLSYHQLIIFTIFTTNCKTPKNLFSRFSAVFVCFGNTINMLKIASKVETMRKISLPDHGAIHCGKGVTQAKGGRRKVGSWCRTYCNLDDNWNGKENEWNVLTMMTMRPTTATTRLTPPSHAAILPIPHPHSSRTYVLLQVLPSLSLSTRLSSCRSVLPPPRPLLPACAAAPPVICIKNIIHCNRKDLHKNILQCGPAA